MLNAPLGRPHGGGSAGSARSCDTSGRPCAWSWLQPCIIQQGLCRTTLYAARRQSAPGVARRPGVLEEPEPPQVDAVLSYRAAGGAPSSALPQLAADDALDSMVLSFLRRKLIGGRGGEEESGGRRRRRRRRRQRISSSRRGTRGGRSTSPTGRRSWSAPEFPLRHPRSSKRKRKKRSKRKLPKSSSGVRIRRCGQGFRSRSSFSGAQCSLLLTTGSRCSFHGRYGTEEQLRAPHVQGWFSWLFCTSRCVSFPVFRPEMLGIMAGMDQEDTYAVCWFLSTAPRIWQPLVRCSPWFDSGYMLRQSAAASVGDC